MSGSLTVLLFISGVIGSFVLGVTMRARGGLSVDEIPEAIAVGVSFAVLFIGLFAWRSV